MPSPLASSETVTLVALLAVTLTLEPPAPVTTAWPLEGYSWLPTRVNGVGVCTFNEPKAEVVSVPWADEIPARPAPDASVLTVVL